MKEHFCPAEQSMIAFEKECNWCGESEGSMNEIIEMARQAGFFIIANSPDLFTKLKAFANLVAAKEREACAKALEDASKEGRIVNLTFALKAIRARGEQA